jgi:Fe2+ or Zn2+ uptake regulation protein
MARDPSVKRKTAVASQAQAEELRAALESAGSRFTQQRAAVFGYLSQVTNHPTAEEVFRAVRRQIPRISLATVYKALEALVGTGLARKYAYGDDAARYDCRVEEHLHLRDVETGELRDLPADYDPALLEKLDPDLLERLQQRGFEVTGYRLEVLGRFAPRGRNG